MKKTVLSRICAAFAASAMLVAGVSCGSNSESSETGSENKAETPASSSETANSSSESTAAEGEDNSLQKVLDNGELILGLDASFPPMGFTDEKNEIIGFDIDVAQEVCDRMGIELVKQPINWDTKEQDLDVGRIDCIWNGMSINASRQEAMNLSDPYMKNEMIFVVPADSDVKSMDDLKGKTIGVQSGSSAQEILEGWENYGDITVTPLDDNVEALRQMEMNFSDAVFLDSIVANYFITSNDKDYVILPGNLESEEYAIGFRKGDQALRDEVQKQLSEMKKDGKLAEISEKWFGSDVTTVE